MIATSTLGQETEFVLDGTHGSPERAKDGIPVLSAQNVRNGSLDWKTTRYTTSSEFESFARRLSLQKGDVLLTIVGTIGRAAVLYETPEPLVFQRSVSVLRPKQDKLDSKFLYYVTQSANFQRQLIKFTNKSSQAGVYLKKLKSAEIPLPPLAEQKRIAAILDAADALRAKRRESLAQLDTLLQSTFLEMFGDPVTNPKGWQKRELDKFCVKVIDCPHSTPRWSESGVICLRTSNLGKGEWIWDDTRFVTEKDYKERTKRSEIKPNDIILSREGTVGVLALVREGMRLCMGQRLVQLRAEESYLHPRFLLGLLLHDLAPERLNRLMAGSTSKHLNVRELRKLPVLLPPLDLQHRFATIVESIERQKTRLRTHLAELDTLFASLQSRAFNGQL